MSQNEFVFWEMIYFIFEEMIELEFIINFNQIQAN